MIDHSIEAAAACGSSLALDLGDHVGIRKAFQFRQRQQRAGSDNAVKPSAPMLPRSKPLA